MSTAEMTTTDMNPESESPSGGTDVGSVFVSNYPPFSFWKADLLDAR